MARARRSESPRPRETLSEKIVRIANDEDARKRTFDLMKRTVYDITREDMDRQFDI